MREPTEVQKRKCREKIILHGYDILESHGMHEGKGFRHHGDINVYKHTITVVCISLILAEKLRIKVDERALVRGALLHDYYLYDWHIDEDWHKWHGFRHPRFALENAKRDFGIGEIEADIIARHMFPLTLHPPKYKESWIVCIADKISATMDYAGR